MQSTTERPAESAGSITSRPATRQRKNKTRTSEPLRADKAETGIPVTDFFKTWPRKDREALIEVLIDTLDAETDDADLEENGDEHESNFAGYANCLSCCDDAEDADSADDEPSLAAPENHVSTPYGGWYGAGERRDDSGNQSHWGQGAANDAEGDEHDGREPEDEGGDGAIEDDEPSLGWTDREAAFGRYVGVNGCEDLEEDAAEMGIADHDGLLEQLSGHPSPGYGASGFARAAI